MASLTVRPDRHGCRGPYAERSANARAQEGLDELPLEKEKATHQREKGRLAGFAGYATRRRGEAASYEAYSGHASLTLRFDCGRNARQTD
jgi:hypothetical protein